MRAILDVAQPAAPLPEGIQDRDRDWVIDPKNPTGIQPFRTFDLTL